MNYRIEMLTINEVAATCRVSTRTVRRWIKSREIGAFLIGGSYMFDRQEFSTWLAGRRVDATKVKR